MKYIKINITHEFYYNDLLFHIYFNIYHYKKEPLSRDEILDIAIKNIKDGVTINNSPFDVDNDDLDQDIYNQAVKITTRLFPEIEKC